MILRAVVDQVLELLEREPELAPRARTLLGAPLASPEPAPALLDRGGLAQALGCSLHHIDVLRREGCPRVHLGDAERFERARVLEWLRARAAHLRGRRRRSR